MTNAVKALTDIRVLEALAAKDTFLHRLHPVVNVAVTMGFIIAVTSYGKYELAAMLPLVLYPLFVFVSGEIPLHLILPRLLPILPLVLGVGAFNPLYDRQTLAVIAGVAISAGWVSFLSIVLRCCLSVISALLLISVVGINGFSVALRTLRVPQIIVVQLTLTFRYIQVLGEEAGRIVLAYRLRAPGQRGIAIRQWGPLTGQWLLRTLKRAERVHQAMLCRGYKGEMPTLRDIPFNLVDLSYLLGWATFFTTIRLINIPQVIGAFALGLLK
ncbi:MAG: energy-coupling factor transporter transmembrane component T family protein [Anaerolineae bacterium]